MRTRKLKSIVLAACLVTAMAMSAQPARASDTYIVTFTSVSGPDPVPTATFTYDSTIPTFTSFQVNWMGMSYDFAATANHMLRFGATGCDATGTLGAQVAFGMLTGACPASFRGNPGGLGFATDPPWQNFDQNSLSQSNPNVTGSDNYTVSSALVPSPVSLLVNTIADHDDGTCNVADCALREAINAANASAPGGTITFSVSGAILLGSSLPNISSTVTIDGSGQTITIDGQQAYQVAQVNNSGATLNLKNVTVAHATQNAGCPGINTTCGALSVYQGTLNATNVYFYQNSSQNGGAITNAGGTLNIVGSTFSANYALYAGGAIFNLGSATVTNSTFSGNEAGAESAIYNYVPPSTLVVTNSTFSGNINDSPGLAAIGHAGTSAVLTNTIIVNTVNGADCQTQNNVTPVSADNYNIADDATCGNATVSTSALIALVPLANNGGPTPTMALGSGSSAIDAGDDAVCLASPVSSLDQRGVARPHATHCDSGAFESTAPTASPAASPAANPAGWNNTDVTVTWNWTDSGQPGIDTNHCTTTSTSSGEGTLQLTATCKSLVVGDTGTASYAVNVDKTAPTISAAATTSPNGTNGWYTSPVTIHFTCSDGTGSGIPAGACPVDQILSAEGSAVPSTQQTVTDAAGNVSLPSNSVTVKIDKTNPTINVSAKTADNNPYTGGWTSQTVTVHYTCSDSGSGVATCPADQIFSADGATSTNGTAIDLAGNSAISTSVAVRIDKTAPSIVASATKADATPYIAGTWTNQNVTVQFACADAGSGVASCPASQVLSADGVTASVSGISIDNAGNSAAAAFGPIQIDKTPPTLSPAVSPNPVALNAAATATPGTADALSGLASQSCAAVATASVGTFSVTCTATDNAGNTNSANASYVVTSSAVTYNAGGPIVLTGWNQDLIAENNAASPQAGTTIAENFNWVWYAQGAPGSTQGLPTSGSFTSALNPSVTFQFQPYTSNNALFYLGGGNGTLTLVTPQAFGFLAFLTSSQYSGSFTATLNFSDGTTTTLPTASDPDWTTPGPPNVALANTGVLQRGPTWSGYYTSNLSLFEHDYTLPAADASKYLVSIQIATTGNEVVFAVSAPTTNFGSVNICPVGQTTPAPCSASLALNYSIDGSVTLGSAVKVLTEGSPNLDFSVSSTTCTGSQTPGSSCTVNVTFAPGAPGLRRGAVQLTDSSGNLLASTLIQGIGQGPAIAFGPGVQTTVGSGLSNTTSVAVDGAGDIFIADPDNSRVVKVPAGGGAQTTVGSGLANPYGVAVDGAGNVFIADSGNSRVVEVPAGGGAQITVGSGLAQPLSVAVDAVGDVFVADQATNQVVEFPANGGAQITVGSGLSGPNGVTVDGAGNVFIADTGNNQVVEVPAGGGAQITVGSELLSPRSVAVDGAGDVYVADLGNHRVVEVPADGSAQTTVGGGLVQPWGVAVDGAGNVFITDALNNAVEVQRSLPPAISFAATAVGSTSTDSPQPVTVQNIGTRLLNTVAPGLTLDPNFPQVAGSGTPADCTSSFALAPGASCNLSIGFTPHSTGALQGVATFSDNALNAAAASHSITLEGTGQQAPAITSAAATTFSVGAAGSFTVTASGNPAPSFSETGALPTGVTFTAAGALSGIPVANSGGTYPIVITASNGVGSNATQNFTLAVSQAPAITSAAKTTFIAGAASSFAVTASGYPAPSFSETGTLPAGVTFTTSGVLSGAASTTGNYSISITASNGVGTNAIQTFTLTIGKAPAITSAAAKTFTVGTAGSFTVTATGFPAPTFSTGTLPTGLTLTAAGILSGTPAANTGGPYTIVITASNGVGANATQNFALTINQASAITSAAKATFIAGAASSFQVTATGYPAPAFTQTGTLPAGVTFTTSGALSGTASTTGTYSITITASNGVGTSAKQTFVLTIGQPPAITSATGATFTVGTKGTLQMTATGFPVPTFSKTGTLPSGVTLTAAGLLSGTPAAKTGAVYNIVVTASNGVGSNATQNFTLTVNQAPAITSAAKTTFIVGTAGSFQVTATGYPAPVFSQTGTLPAGVTLTAGGLLAGTPAANTGGTYNIVITASNGVGSNATQDLTLTINQAPVITTPAATTFTIGTPGSFQVTASGFPAPTKFTETGTLPRGITFTSAGVLGGTPATGTARSYNVVITTSNGVGASATQNFTLTVH